jgi:hypothetical protein
MSALAKLSVLFASLLIASLALSKEPLTHAQKIAALIDPGKLSTLAPRGANPRVQKYVALLFEAQQAGLDPVKCATEAAALVGMKGDAAQVTAETMVRNLRIAGQLGCLTTEGLAEMRRGRSPTVTRGPYTGDALSVDHIIPAAVMPQLDHVIANLELMPLRMNQSKGDKTGERQARLEERLKSAGLLNPATAVPTTGGH